MKTRTFDVPKKSLPSKSKQQKKKTEKERLIPGQPIERVLDQDKLLSSKQEKSTIEFDALVKLGIIDPQAVELVQKSLLAPQIGRAVIAKRSFSPNQVICSYGGNIISEAAVQKLFAKYGMTQPRVSYMVSVDENWTIDGWPRLASVKKHVGNYINDARGIQGAQVNCAINLVLNEAEDKVVYVVIEALTDINPGDELWLDYGNDYWSK